MQEFYAWLSGSVPGGFMLLSFLLLTVNVALYFFYRSSKLFNRDVYQRQAVRYNIFIIALYIILWIALRPPQLPPRYAILPFQKGDSLDIRVSEGLQYSLTGRFDDGFIRHRWEWFYQTANKDSLADPVYRDSLAHRLNLDFVVTGRISEEPGQLQVTCIYGAPFAGDSFTVAAGSYAHAVRLLIGGLQERTGKFADAVDPAADIENITRNAPLKKRLLDGDARLSPEEVHGEDAHAATLQAQILLHKGVTQKPKQAKTSNFMVQESNPGFQRLQNMLLRFSREGSDTAEMNLILGEMYLHRGNYGLAEICLEKALSQDPFNARVYYYLGYLHESRFKEYGFGDREEVLSRAVQLDPGYAEAALLLADEYYFTGSGTSSGHSTQQALLTIRNYLKINPLEPALLNLLGRIYLQTKYTREAMMIYRELVERFPDRASYSYNLGVSLYQLKAYDEAEPCFRRAIDLADELDAYLYMGAIKKQRGELEDALAYFRERIRRKTGPDDHYAKEAMRQVRIIRSELGLDSLEAAAGGE